MTQGSETRRRKQKNTHPLSGKILFSLIMVSCYLFGKKVMIPWVEQDRNSLPGHGLQALISAAMGNDTAAGSVLAVGFMPYMTSMIVVSLFHSVKGKRTQTSRKRMGDEMRVVTLLVAILQSVMHAFQLTCRDYGSFSIPVLRAMTVMVLIAGTFYIVWLSERCRKWGIGGSTALILANIVQNIMRNLDDFLLETAMQQVFSYMENNQCVILQAVTQNAQENVRRELAGKLLAILEKNEITGIGIGLENGAMELLPVFVPEGGSCRVQVISCHSENDLIQRLYDVRLILDVRDQPDLYLQIAGISAGIPQVNYRFTRYVQHQKDGYIIQNIHYISGALEYYLSGLKHWNEALVYCVKEIEKYTGGSLVQQWKEAVEDDAK